VLFKEGDVGNFFYIIKSGELAISFSNLNKTTKVIKEGGTFGELALIQKTQRSGTVRSNRLTEVYCLEGSVFREILRKINSVDMAERNFIIRLITIFKGLDNAQINNLASSMIKCEFKNNERILTEGDKSESLFIIKEGNVSCMKNNLEVKRLGLNDYFGESSILFETKRSMSIISAGRTICYQITKNVLQETLGDNFRTVILQSILRESFVHSKIMKNFLIEFFFPKIFDCFKINFYKSSQIIYKRENEAKKVIVVIQGSLFNATTNEIVADRCQLYGDMFLKTLDSPVNDINVSANSCVMEAKWEDISNIFDINVDKRKLVSFIIRLAHIKKINIFRNLSDLRLIEICKKMKKHKYSKDEIVFNEGTEADYLYLLNKGKVQAWKGERFLREIEEGICFGEASIILNEPKSATIKAVEPSAIFLLSKEDFFNLIDKNILDFLIRKISLQDNFSVNLEDLYYVKTLGEGKFGYVSLVHNNKNLFAIKAVNRKAADKQKMLINYFKMERSILLSLDHQFIVKLVKTLKNDEFIFYLMEFVNGITLATYLENRIETKLRCIEETQFFIATLLIIVEYLNSKRIAHRDIKPDNIIVDENGYLKLIDFGTAVVLKDFTNTIVGTPHYIAPEVLLGKGYSFPADYWSIGITAYETYFNKYPFGDGATDPMIVYKDVLKKKSISFPGNVEQNFQSFICCLLKKKPVERICNLSVLKTLPFYSGFNFVRVIVIFRMIY
jgi:cGMP-dependent protein kinase